MELHSPTAGKRLWNFLRVAFYMMRKGLISKRKLIMDMNLMVKRGKLVGKKTLGNLMFHHHHHHHSRPRGSGYRFQDYEFSCSNSPNPVFFHAAAKRRHNYFPCIHAIAEDDQSPSPSPVIVLPRIEFSPQTSHGGLSELELSPGDRHSSPLVLSPLSVRVSDFSDDDGGDNSGRREVDDEAEEFIKRFYEQLRAQSRIALLQYQEMEYQNMLARGA